MKAEKPNQRRSHRRGQLTGRHIAATMVRRQWHQRGSRPRPVQAEPRQPVAREPAQVEAEQVVPDGRPLELVGDGLQRDPEVPPRLLEETAPPPPCVMAADFRQPEVPQQPWEETAPPSPCVTTADCRQALVDQFGFDEADLVDNPHNEELVNMNQPRHEELWSVVLRDLEKYDML